MRGAVVALAIALTVAACGAPTGSVTVPRSSPAASGTGRVLAAAPYAIDTMTPSFSINLPEGFVLQALAADQFFISRGADRAASGLAIVRLAAGGLVERLDLSPGFANKSRVMIQLGSMVGPSIAMATAPGQAQPPVLFESAEIRTAYVLPLGAQARVIEFTVGATPVAFVYFAPAAEFGTFEPFIQGILTSLAWRT